MAISIQIQIPIILNSIIILIIVILLEITDHACSFSHKLHGGCINMSSFWVLLFACACIKHNRQREERKKGEREREIIIKKIIVGIIKNKSNF